MPAVSETDPYPLRRVAGVKFTPEFIFNLLQLNDLFPDAKWIQGAHDFDSNTFKIKWVSEAFEPLEDGKTIPYLEVVYKTVDGKPVAVSYTK
jgi:hypothetical protein